MAEFQFKARSLDGQLVEGVITASDRRAAVALVEAQSRVPIRVEPVATAANSVKPKSIAGAGGRGGSGNGNGNGNAIALRVKPPGETFWSQLKNLNIGSASNAHLRLSHKYQHLFSEQLAHLLGAGLTLDEALSVLEKRLKHPTLQHLSKTLHRSLVDGLSLSQAMREFPRIFGALYVNMVAAGEASGSLPVILNRLTGYLAEVKLLRDRVQQALLYPSILFIVGILLIIAFMTTMVPQLVGFFKDMQGTLPPATRFLIAANQFFSSYWWLMIGGAVAAYAGFQTLIQTAGGRAWWHRVSWGLPVLSIIPQHRFYAQFARTLSTLTENGVTMLRALELLEDAAGNDYIRDKMREVRAAVVDGATLSAALHARKIFPDLFVDMMAVGEQTGKFSETMSMIADVYERELDKQVQVVSTLIPPLVMVMVAVVIGSVVYGVLSAVFNLTSSLHHVRR